MFDAAALFGWSVSPLYRAVALWAASAVVSSVMSSGARERLCFLTYFKCRNTVVLFSLGSSSVIGGCDRPQASCVLGTHLLRHVSFIRSRARARNFAAAGEARRMR